MRRRRGLGAAAWGCVPQPLPRSLLFSCSSGAGFLCPSQPHLHLSEGPPCEPRDPRAHNLSQDNQAKLGMWWGSLGWLGSGEALYWIQHSVPYDSLDQPKKLRPNLGVRGSMTDYETHHFIPDQFLSKPGAEATDFPGCAYWFRPTFLPDRKKLPRAI